MIIKNTRKYCKELKCTYSIFQVQLRPRKMVTWEICNGSVYPCTLTKELSLHTDSQMTHLQYQMTLTTSLGSKPMQKNSL